MQQQLLEDQITAHRKAKKALSAKHRTARKAGRPLTEDDAAQLRHVTEQQGAVQKQLEQVPCDAACARARARVSRWDCASDPEAAEGPHGAH